SGPWHSMQLTISTGRTSRSKKSATSGSIAGAAGSMAHDGETISARAAGTNASCNHFMRGSRDRGGMQVVGRSRSHLVMLRLLDCTRERVGRQPFLPVPRPKHLRAAARLPLVAPGWHDRPALTHAP